MQLHLAGQSDCQLALTFKSVMLLFQAVVYLWWESCTCGYGLYHIELDDGLIRDGCLDSACVETGGRLLDFVDCWYMAWWAIYG